MEETDIIVPVETTPLVPDAVPKAEKKKKKEKGNKDDDIKTHMANERTFFKWLFFGFHLGALGTFILTFFDPYSPGRTWVVLFVWIVAFFFIYYGLFRYFERRRALRLGLRDPRDWDDAVGPAMMAGAMFLVVGVIVVYALTLGQVPAKRSQREF